MIVLAIACVIICLVGSASQAKTRFVIPVVVIVGCTTLFFATVSVHDPHDTSSDTTKRYNRTAMARSAVAGVMIGFTVISGFSLLLTHMISARQGQLIGEATRRSLDPRVF